MATHGKDLRFLVLFGFLMGLYYLASTTAVVKDRFFPWYLETSARVCGAIVHIFGYDDMEVKGNALVCKRGSISVERGCDAITPCALFVAAVLASPVPWRAKIPGAAVGCLILMAINLVRIISLFVTRVHWQQAFDIMHLDVWQSLFILFSIVLWALWAAWERGRQRRRRHAPS